MAPDAASLCYLPRPYSPVYALSSLAEPIATWFEETFVAPTPAQCYAWPTLCRSDNLLLCAPTGTGKTLAAFLPIIGKLWDDPRDGLACLYVAPLKALGRDVRKNLQHGLHAIEQDFRAARGQKQRRYGANKNRIRVGLRTGDSSSRSRSRQLEKPPHVLLTTPESLAVMLTNPRACDIFRTLRWVIVDEVHALAVNKRGADLALSLERLEALVAVSDARGLPGLQRIGLSATCFPVETAARFLVGIGRSCAIAQVPDQAPLDLTIEPLPHADPDTGFMARLVDRLEREIRVNQTTLIFSNVRSTAERLTWSLKRRFPEIHHLIAVHHSSLTARRRRQVERRLKEGRLEVVVTSTSLELGIDIGSVDGVVLLHPPGSVVRLLQRLGRSGHRPGQPRRGLLLTSGTGELLEATVTGASGLCGQFEPLDLPLQPLDVLCQHLVGMAMISWWSRDEAYELVRRAYPYRSLSREDFDHCLTYLSGRRQDGTAWLPPRLRWEEGRFAILDQRTSRLLRRNLGTILSEEPRAVRLILPDARQAQSGHSPSLPIGSLDDAYADRLRPGDRFLLDGRCLEYRRRERGAVLVEEVTTRPLVPHWSGAGWAMSRELARRLFFFRLQAAELLRDGPEHLRGWLAAEYDLGTEARAELIRWLLDQESASEIPDARTLLVEIVPDESGVAYYLHTPLNRPGNDALARVVSLRLLSKHGLLVRSFAADLGFCLMTSCDRVLGPMDWRALCATEKFDDDLEEAIRESDSLRERFAQVATTGLMVLRHPLGGRRKVGGQDWVQRRLFDQIRKDAPDFVLLRQAEHEIKTHLCEADAARSYLTELPNCLVRCRRLLQISPFASAWTPLEQAAGEAFLGPEEALAELTVELTGTMAS